MTRREIIAKSGLIALGAMVPLHSVKAADESGGLTVSSRISSNHGHELNLTLSELVVLLRETNTTGQPNEVSIQGQSGHEHLISLDTQLLMDLLLLGEIEITSSKVSGHNHRVSIALK